MINDLRCIVLFILLSLKDQNSSKGLENTANIYGQRKDCKKYSLKENIRVQIAA
jgi:hypothetical protein